MSDFIKNLLGDEPNTTQLFWDCNCNDNYIKRKDRGKCNECGATSGPDSRLNEIENANIEVVAGFDNEPNEFGEFEVKSYTVCGRFIGTYYTDDIDDAKATCLSINVPKHLRG